MCWKRYRISGVVGKERNIGFVGFLGNVEPKWCRKYRKWLCCEISQRNPDLKRVWPFGGIFCLTFFREGCSPAALLDEPPLPSSAIEALCACHADIYPNVYILLTILGTLPVSTATRERRFSTMRRLKTYLRSSVGNERMTGLALLSIHKDRQIDKEKKLWMTLLPSVIADLISCFSIYKICERDYFTKAKDLKWILYDKQLPCPWPY